MSEFAESTNNAPSVTYELAITRAEAQKGAEKLLMRNGKRLQVTIPAGVSSGSVVKLTGALQKTDLQPGDILIHIKIKTEDAGAENEMPPGVVVVTDSSFSSEVLDSRIPVVVDFWAAWCGPCRMMAPVMDKTAIQYRGKFKFCKINVDENPASASQFQAMSIPMLLF